METSKQFTLNTMDWKKIAMWAIMAGIGALLAYFTDLIPTIDFWAYTPLVVAGFSILANIVRKRLESK